MSVVYHCRPDFPTEADVHAILAINDDTVRNRWITWAYHRLDQRMAAFLGSDDLSWCGFGTWGSYTAGRVIQKQHLPDEFAMLLDAFAGRYKEWLPVTWIAETTSEIAAIIAAGNRAVFADIGLAFARFLEGISAGRDADRVIASLETRNKPRTHELRAAFASYVQASNASTTREKAQHVLYANTMIAHIEQQHVQPFIAQALNVPMKKLFALLPWVVGQSLKPLAGRAFRRAATLLAMRLHLPNESLALAKDLPSHYPQELTTLNCAKLRQLFRQLNATDATGSAAGDWASFEDRMRYLAVLLRVRQQDKTLRQAPAYPGFSPHAARKIDAQAAYSKAA